MRFMGDVKTEAEKTAYHLATQTTGGAQAHDADMSFAKKQGVILGALGGLVAGFFLFRKKRR